MPLTLTELKDLHEKAYTSGQVTRERAADDLVFFWITHWDDQTWSDSSLEYRGEYDMIRSAGKQILADLAENPVQNDFEPINETPEEMADIADGLYRRDANQNVSIEAFAVGEQEAVVCGVGEWELKTKYRSNKTGDKKQTIVREPNYGANNNSFWDPNAKRIDKSDAHYHSRLDAYSEGGYIRLVKELTGEDIDKTEIKYSDPSSKDVSPGSFGHPEHSYTFPWVGGEGEKIYVVRFYHREKVKQKIVTMSDPFGEVTEYREKSIESVMDEMLDAGFTVEEEKIVDGWEVRKYIASGSEILNGKMVDGERTGERIAGEFIPVIPIYGEYAIVEDEIHYEGVTRLAKDPQRNRDFAFSYLTDIWSKSPREKPIFFPEQISGHTQMYEMNGVDNNYPYLLQNRKTVDGEDLPIGAVGMMPAPQIPQALAATLELTSQAIREVANPGLPQDIADPDLSGKAVLAIGARLDKQSMVYQQNKKHALRRDGEVYISMASEIHDTPRKEKIELPDGTKKEIELMSYVMDEETGNLVVLNDLRTSEFEVSSRIGASYSSQKEQTLDRLEKTLATMAPDDPMRKAVQLKIIQLADGVEMKDLKEYANKQLVLSGIKEPETDEEKELLAQAQQQPKEPDAAMKLAEAENKKGDADILNAQREGVKMNLDDENEKMKNSINMFKAETDRMKLQVVAQEAGAKITKTGAETMGVNIDNETKIKEIQSRSVADMSDEELFRELMAS